MLAVVAAITLSTAVIAPKSLRAGDSEESVRPGFVLRVAPDALPVGSAAAVLVEARDPADGAPLAGARLPSGATLTVERDGATAQVTFTRGSLGLTVRDDGSALLATDTAADPAGRWNLVLVGRTPGAAQLVLRDAEGARLAQAPITWTAGAARIVALLPGERWDGGAVVGAPTAVTAGDEVVVSMIAVDADGELDRFHRSTVTATLGDAPKADAIRGVVAAGRGELAVRPTVAGDAVTLRLRSVRDAIAIDAPRPLHVRAAKPRSARLLVPAVDLPRPIGVPFVVRAAIVDQFGNPVDTGGDALGVGAADGATASVVALASLGGEARFLVRIDGPSASTAGEAGAAASLRTSARGDESITATTVRVPVMAPAARVDEDGR